MQLKEIKDWNQLLVTFIKVLHGQDIYKSIEEKGANFLYLIVKNHVFVDGNKRIAATLFIYFLNFYGILYKNDKQVIDNNTLTTLTLLIAESNPKEKDIITGTVQRYSNGNYTVNIGKIDTVLTEQEQVKTERFRSHEKIRVYVTEVKDTPRGPRIVISRTHPELVKRLFEAEVAEIQSGVVEIKSVSREADTRTKIAVYSRNPEVDAVGACVGMNGARVNAVVNELRGEKIDIVVWNEIPAIFIEHALSPSRVVSVTVDIEEKSALVVVPDYQLSLAIGKEGQNARLAAKLTGYKIDIKSETQNQEG